ncbi:MAG: hypothetical protein K2I82_00935 [Ruminococcus sp.]|nr:hypothetical protein [Ruminococcus sp.]
MEDMLSECSLGVNAVRQINDTKGMASFSLAKIADVLGVSVDYLLGRTDEPENNINVTGNTQNNIHGSNSINISEQKKLDEMSAELLKKFSKLSFDEKIDVFNYIKNKE